MILGDYSARRAKAVEQQWADLGRRDRRRTNCDEIEATYDERNLCICDTCALAYPLPPDGVLVASRCPHCGGTIREGPERRSVPLLAHALKDVQNRLRQMAVWT